jgi:type II secretory pathway component GspD/PulD (secretin)
VIGGVTNSIQREEVRKVPTLGDIPLLGWMFKQRGTQDLRRELIVFITPTVLKGEAEAVLPRPAASPVPAPVPPPPR